MTRFPVIALCFAAAFAAAVSCVTVSAPTEAEIVLRPVTEAPVKAPVLGTAFPAGRTLLLSATTDGGAEWFTGIPFRRDASSGVWRGTSPKYWPPRSTLAFFSCSTEAFSSSLSWNAVATTGATVVVADNGDAQDDILFSAATGASSSQSVTMRYSHAMALLSFTASADLAYDAAANTGVTITALTLSPAWWGGTLAVTAAAPSVSFAWGALSARRERAVDGASVSVTASAAEVGAPLVLPPQPLVGFTVEYVLHNGRDAGGAAVDLPLDYTYIPDDGALESGVRTVYNIHFALGYVYVSTTLEPWHEVSQEVTTGLFSTQGVTTTGYYIGGDWQL